MADQQLLSEQNRALNGSIVAAVTDRNAAVSHNDIDKLKNNSNGDINGFNSINRKIDNSSTGTGTGTSTTKIVYEFSTNEAAAPQSFEPPDGGARAWCVMISGFFCNSIIFGIINTCGTIYVKLFEYLNEIGVEEAASKACKLQLYVIYTRKIHGR